MCPNAKKKGCRSKENDGLAGFASVVSQDAGVQRELDSGGSLSNDGFQPRPGEVDGRIGGGGVGVMRRMMLSLLSFSRSRGLMWRNGCEPVQWKRPILKPRRGGRHLF